MCNPMMPDRLAVRQTRQTQRAYTERSLHVHLSPHPFATGDPVATQEVAGRAARARQAARGAASRRRSRFLAAAAAVSAAHAAAHGTGSYCLQAHRAASDRVQQQQPPVLDAPSQQVPAATAERGRPICMRCARAAAARVWPASIHDCGSPHPSTIRHAARQPMPSLSTKIAHIMYAICGDCLGPRDCFSSDCNCWASARTEQHPAP